MLLDILEEHFDEASFLYERWKADTAAQASENDGAVDIPERLRTHLQGLALGGADAWTLCQPKLTPFGPGAVFVAAWVSMAVREQALELDPAALSGSGLQDALRDALRVASAR